MGMRGEIEDKEKMDEGNEGRKTDSTNREVAMS